MTEFSIYQINTDRDDNRICFLGLDTANARLTGALLKG